MNVTEQFVLKVLTAYIHESPFSMPSTIDHDFFKTLIQAHGLMPLVYEPLKKSHYPYLQPYKDALTHHTLLQTQQSALLDEVLNNLQAQHIEVCLFKGVILKDTYPSPTHRTMGDVDFLYHPKDQEKLHTILTDLKFQLVSRGVVHDVYKKAPLILEPHKILFAPEHEHYHNFFNTPFTHKEKRTFEITYHYLYLITHIAKHFKSAGSGLRNMLDIVFFTQKHHTLFDHATLNKGLKTLHLYRFHQALLHTINHYLHYKSPLLDETHAPTRQTLEHLMDFMMHSGTYGFKNSEQIDRVRFSLEGSRLRYYFKKVFPKRRTLAYQYPTLSKRQYYPLLIVYRILKLLKTKSSRQRLKALKTNKQQTTQINTLYKDIGLQ